MRVAFVTGGTVGAGHLVRGLALRRGLARAGFAGEYRMLGPALPFPLATAEAGYQPVEIKEDLRLREARQAAESDLARALLAFAPDLVVVDLFWAPLRWVLPHLAAEAWLLVRTCPAPWLSSRLGMPFAPEQYARIVAIEPIEHPEIGETIDPLVIANPEECRPPTALRERFGVPLEEPLQVVLHAGLPGELARLAPPGEPAHTLTLDLHGADPLFPACEWLGGADRIVCGAGYNSFWEAHWLGYAPRTRFVPFARSIDDQAARIERFSGHRPRENGADVLARWIAGG